MKSSTKTKSLDPEWDERFEMDVDEPSESLEVRLYDYDVTSADDFMGLVRQGSRHHHRRRRHDHRPQATAHPPTIHNQRHSPTAIAVAVVVVKPAIVAVVPVNPAPMTSPGTNPSDAIW